MVHVEGKDDRMVANNLEPHYRDHGVGSLDHIQESDISMLYYLSHSHFI